ncbi:MAG: replication restart DNA helicase PriA [Cyanobacteria bacterium RI_101]|jgi:predicted RNA-binding Zn-ribbon protein involved in translation (DUF1610 family)|nr:replication restart DNA helicase PriA [Cyanobacteria bacterium RI_101]
MSTQIIHCPNCGSYAHRRHLPQLQIVETACPVCDYLLVSCGKTGKVVESYIANMRGKESSPASRI